MRFGLLVQMTGSLGYPQPLVRLAREAEAAGWDGFFIWDVFGGASEEPTPVVDPWVALTAMAAATERIRRPGCAISSRKGGRRGRANTLVRAAIGHATSFQTWHSLVRDQQLNDAAAVTLMVTMIRCVARGSAEGSASDRVA